ncbi:MAG: hypothetical protein EOP83_12845 [Verrucomicrobiaceae bacterium]|nr:MAG: hypothetical protein EOP83_12845 [Verrucomicrobiaceae bacterium]
MGLLSDLLLGDLSQSFSIDEQRSAIRAQARKQSATNLRMHDASMAMDRLKRQNGELRLAVVALTRFLIERGVVNESELEAFIRKIDAEDGKMDGSLAIPPPPKPGAP